MSIHQRPDPTSIRPGVPIAQTPSGRPRPAGVPDTEAYFAAINDAGDGVEAGGPLGQRNYYAQLLQSVSWPEDGGGITTMHPVDAAILALAHLIRRMKWQSADLRMIGGGDEEPPRPPAIAVHQLDAIHFDWPRWDTPDIPVHNAVITSGEESRWQPEGSARSSYLIDGESSHENTVGVFGEGTVLRSLGEWPEIPLSLQVWFAHTDIRRGFDARICSLLAAERMNEAWHRRVRVPEYFGREVKLMLVGRQRPIDPVFAQQNRWPLEVTVLAEVEQVELVRVPGYVSEARVGVEVDGAT